MKPIKVIYIITIFVLTSCIKEPTGPDDNYTVYPSHNGAYILCEGLWGMDNASLDRIIFDSNSFQNNIFEIVNSGLRLGDLASDMIIINERLLISVTTAKTIESIDLKTCLSLGRLKFSGKRAPRRITLINENLAAVTDLYNHSIAIFNPKTLDILIDNILTGPAPEGIAYHNGILFVVNSGFGDYLADVPNASTITLIETSNFTELASIQTGPNPIEILINEKHNTMYVSYNHLPSKKDSLGGIIEYDLKNLTEKRRLNTIVRNMHLSVAKDTLFFISTAGIDMIDLQKNFSAKTIINNNSHSDIWYSLGIAPNGDIWIGNAKNYQVQGEVVIYDKLNFDSPKRKYKTGVNPVKIIFY